MNKKALQISVGIASLAPLYLGFLGFINGAENFFKPDEMINSLDSSIRFRSALFFMYGMLFLWTLPNIEKQTTLFRLLLAGLFLGGIGRLISIVKFGMPPTFIFVVLVLELGLPVIFAPWQAMVARNHSQ